MNAKATGRGSGPKVFWSDDEKAVLIEAGIELRLNNRTMALEPCLKAAQKAALPAERWRKSFNTPKARQIFEEIVQGAKRRREAEERKQEVAQILGMQKDPQDIQVPEPGLESPVGPRVVPSIHHEPESPSSANVEASRGLPEIPFRYHNMSIPAIIQRFDVLVRVIEEMVPRIEERIADNNTLLELLLEKGYGIEGLKTPKKIQAYSTPEEARPRRIAVLGILPGQAKIITDILDNSHFDVKDFKDTMPNGKFDLIIASRFMSHKDFGKTQKQADGPMVVCHGGSTTIAETIRNYFANGSKG